MNKDDVEYIIPDEIIVDKVTKNGDGVPRRDDVRTIFRKVSVLWRAVSFFLSIVMALAVLYFVVSFCVVIFLNIVTLFQRPDFRVMVAYCLKRLKITVICMVGFLISIISPIWGVTLISALLALDATSDGKASLLRAIFDRVRY